MNQQRREGGKPVRIISELATLPQFVRSCYDAWRDGCNNCVACTCIDSYERGESDHQRFTFRMALLFDVLPDRVNHPLELPRAQLSLFANRRRA